MVPNAAEMVNKGEVRAWPLPEGVLLLMPKRIRTI